MIAHNDFEKKDQLDFPQDFRTFDYFPEIPKTEDFSKKGTTSDRKTAERKNIDLLLVLFAALLLHCIANILLEFPFVEFSHSFLLES
jgi:hypothetical protein